MKKMYSVTLNVVVDVKRGVDGRPIPWIHFIGWKDGIITDKNRFIKTKPIVRMTEQNMEYIGEHIFEAVRKMIYEDEDLSL